jgi:peroxiredoxin (alkyl hydroperoxide reductase subunit C)
MATLTTRPAPDFTADAVLPDDSFEEITLSSYKGKYVLLFFYPLDFTFVCPSEILAFSRKVAEFKKRGCVVLGCSVDSKYTHWAWRQVPVDQGGIGKIAYPLIADIDKSIARKYGVLFNESVALRGLFLIDKNGVVRHELVNDLPLGRSTDEALRTLDALRFVDEHGDMVCPANWQDGQDAMKPTAEGVADYLAAHAKA